MYDQGNYDKKRETWVPAGLFADERANAGQNVCLYELVGAAIHAFGPPWQAAAVSLRREALLRLYHCSHAPTQRLEPGRSVLDVFPQGLLCSRHQEPRIQMVLSAFSML
jgi:hypothetical protein